MQDTRRVSPDLYFEQRYREGKFYCDICLDPWPMSHQRKMRGGQRVGVLCCYEPEGDDVERTLRRAAATAMAAKTSQKELQPPKAPDGSSYAGTRPYSADVAIVTITPAPAVLVRGGSAVPIVLTGNGFTVSDSFTYGDPGITDNSAPALISATEWDLSVKASVAVPVGLYSLTFNTGSASDRANTIWRAVFDVR